MTQLEVAAFCGVSRSRIDAMEKQALAKVAVLVAGLDLGCGVVQGRTPDS